MNELEQKRKRIPQISSERLDTTLPNVSTGNSKEELLAHAFIKGKEPIQSMTLRLPLGLYKNLREIAFKTDDKISRLILSAIKKYLAELGSKST
jgi:hypothetical protein